MGGLIMRYEIQTQFIYGWENVWECDGQLEYFATKQDAQNALDDFFEEVESDYFNGYIEDKYSRNDYRIVEVLP